MLLAAIRQAEDNGELLERTVLKLRPDQKGNKSSTVGSFDWKAKYLQYLIETNISKPPLSLSLMSDVSMKPVNEAMKYFNRSRPLHWRLPHAEALLRYCVAWNTNAKNCQDAQVVLQVLLTHVPPEELLQYQGARTHLEALIPYTGQPTQPSVGVQVTICKLRQYAFSVTERHMQRIGRLLQASMFLNYMWQKMRVVGEPSG